MEPDLDQKWTQTRAQPMASPDYPAVDYQMT